MLADDIATAIDKAADFGKKGGHGDTSGRLQEMYGRTVYSLARGGNSRSIQALSVSDGICPLPHPIPRTATNGIRAARDHSLRRGSISTTSSTPSAASSPPRRMAIIQRPLSGPHFHVPHMRPSPS
jgi:hypothetical protein